MAAMSAIHGAAALTPPTSAYDGGYSWSVSASGEPEDARQQGRDERGFASFGGGGSPVMTQNGNPTAFGSVSSVDQVHSNHGHEDAASDMKAKQPEASYMSPPYHKDSKSRSAKETDNPAGSLLDLNGSGKGARTDDTHKRPANDITGNSSGDDNSKWIHRDKLARIENEELQAAGIILPVIRDRARSKSQTRGRRERDPSQDKANGYTRDSGTDSRARSRKASDRAFEPRTPDVNVASGWDLRLPEEIEAEDDGYWVSNGGLKVSRIPIAKASPAPIPSEHLERDRLMPRKRDSSPGEDETITYPKPRARSGSTGNALAKTTTNGSTSQGTTAKRNDSSPKKGNGPRKVSAPKPANGAAGRPRTRGGPSKDSTTSSGGGTTRPSTRSGERELSPGSSRPMEGEPPWMVSAYRPDPRLPPEQQLLPTVAKRLQQERWEKEGKFGNIYDREFRPLNDEGFLKPPEAGEKDRRNADGDGDGGDNHSADWPLRADQQQPPKSPSLSLPARTGSYSTMPRISDKPLSPIPSPRTPSIAAVAGAHPQRSASIMRAPDAEEGGAAAQKKDEGGCGCCVIM